MNISVRVDDEEGTLIKSYAHLKNITVSDLVRKAVLEQIEDEYDLHLYNKAMEEYKRNPITYSLNDIEKELGFIWNIM